MAIADPHVTAIGRITMAHSNLDFTLTPMLLGLIHPNRRVGRVLLGNSRYDDKVELLSRILPVLTNSAWVRSSPRFLRFLRERAETVPQETIIPIERCCEADARNGISWAPFRVVRVGRGGRHGTRNRNRNNFRAAPHQCKGLVRLLPMERRLPQNGQVLRMALEQERVSS